MADYILFDCPPPHDFVNGVAEVSGHGWRCLSCDGRASVPRRKRLVRYLTFPLRFLLRRKIGRVIAWQQFYGLSAAYLASILHLHRRMRITVMTFIYKPKRGLAGRLHRHFVNRAVSNRRISEIIVFSPREVELYSAIFPKAAGKFSFVPLGVPLTDFPAAADEGYIFTAGMSNRDYGFLFDALGGTGYEVRVACPGVSAPPGCGNIRVLSDCFGADMERELAGCHAVVIPLLDPDVSSGQLMLLQAMQAGKPAVVAGSGAMSAYIDDGVTAISIAKDREALLCALRRLYADGDAYRRMSESARAKAMSEFTDYEMGRKIGRLTVR